MIKLVRILLVLYYLFITTPVSLEARQPRRNQYEDTVTESIWDWATTLGKSPKKKKTIKAKRRIQRAKKRAEKKANIERAKREKENKARLREVQKARDDRIRARRKEIGRKKRQ